MGESPTGQLLRKDQANQRQLEQHLQHQQRLLQQQNEQQQTSGAGSGNAFESVGGNGAAGNAGECAQMRAALANADQRIADAERTARAATTDGSINPRYAPEINGMRALRGQFQAGMRSKGCF
jgi:hypothetical protein